MSAFKKAWGILKENDDVPDEDFHRLNDPNPTIAFGAAMRNNPMIADMMQQREEAYRKPYSEGGVVHQCENCGKRTDTNYDDVWSDSFCSKRCEDGLSPTCREISNENCQFVLTEQPSYNREYSDAVGSPHFSVEIACPKCQNTMIGEVAGD
jgi:endogenous inhibitor of DNA gyrase (YacG/DUF329 family)